jgi:hypothetical protein
MGAMLSGRWHDSHFAWKIGATSFVNVTCFGESAAIAVAGTTSAASASHAPLITGSFLVAIGLVLDGPNDVELFRSVDRKASGSRVRTPRSER